VRRAPGPEPKLHGRKVPPRRPGSSTIFSAACTIRVADSGNRQRPHLNPSGLGYQHPPGGHRTFVNARRAVVPAHPTHARHRTSLRMTLSISAWNLRPGISLGRPGKAHAAKHGTRSTGCSGRPQAAGLAMTALTGPLLKDAAHRRSSGPSLTGGYAARPAQAVLRPPPTPTRPAIHFPGSPVTGRHAPQHNPQAAGPGRTSTVPAVTIGTFRAPYAGESFAAAPPALHRFRGLHPGFGGPALPAPPEGETSNDAAGFA